ncbi:MAG: triose-phosphate isomerase [Patescibacteria group bacterium]|jgi:triosephosphate isomerase
MPKTIIAANWKMNKNKREVTQFLTSLKTVKWNKEKEVVLCAPYTLLPLLDELNKKAPWKIGAENMHDQESGAFTGEVSPLMLKDTGCEYVIIGHSERRQFFGETNESVNKKLKSALAHNLTPIFCVGETLEQREKNETEQVVTQQIQEGLKDIKTLNQIVIAYEPVWAIGTGKVATPEQAQEVHALIRKLTSPEISILYGGSVKPENIKDLMAQKDINGALVGGASLEAESFAKIVNY